MAAAQGGTQNAMAELQQKRAAMEKELAALQAEEKRLSKGHKVLTDAQGFPLADVDVHAVRIARNSIARLQTDYTALMKAIEKLVFEHFKNPNPQKIVSTHDAPPKPVATAVATAAAADVKAKDAAATAPAAVAAGAAAASAAPAAGAADSAKSAADAKAAAKAAEKAAEAKAAADAAAAADKAARDARAAELARVAAFGVRDAFFVVQRVWENSPASAAGLRTGDRIVEFGSINRANYATDKAALPALVAHSENRPVAVVVHRNGEGNKALTLTPHKWEGNGLLGCHIVPC